MPEVELVLEGEGLAIANLLKDADLVATTSEALRMIKQGAVKVDGESWTMARHSSVPVPPSTRSASASLPGDRQVSRQSLAPP